MDYTIKPKYHYTCKNSWVNDPNGLCYYKGYYHLFYQHDPGSEFPRMKMSWGHARTKDFLTWEELPVALHPEAEYEKDGCWSGTAAAKDGVLYLFYASVKNPPSGAGTKIQTVSVAYSTDGIHFEKYEGNPILHKNDKIVGVGHHSFTKVGENKWICAYHSHFSTNQFRPRVTRLDYAEFVEDENSGKDILRVNGPTGEATL